MSDKPHITRRSLLGMGGAAALAYPLVGLAAAAETPNAAPLKMDKDVVVGKGGDADLHVDIYHPPAGTEKHMALVHLHGGGFARGSKDTIGPQVTPITTKGYLSVTVEYRLAGVAKWPAQNSDVKNAIRWTRENAARLGVDPSASPSSVIRREGISRYLPPATPRINWPRVWPSTLSPKSSRTALGRPA